MEQSSTTADTDGRELLIGEAWFDPIEAGIRDRVRGFIEELLEQELTQALGRSRHERGAGGPNGYRNGAPRAPAPWLIRPSRDQRAARADDHRGRRHAGVA